MVARPRIGPTLVLGLALLLWLCAGTATAKPGQVDIRYGYNGTVDLTGVLPGPEFQRGALAVAVGPQSESVVLSYATRACAAGPGTCADLYVTRVLADGSIDAAFGARAGVVASVDWGDGGWAVGPNGAIAVQADGKVVVAAGDGVSAQLTRLNPDGSRDTSFRNPTEPARPAGESAILIGNRVTVTDLALRPAGEAVVAGGAGNDFFLSRLTAAGQPDPGFGVGGTRFDNFQPTSLPGGLLLRGSSAVVAGNACCAIKNYAMVFAEYDAAGGLADVVKVGLPKRLSAGKPKGVADLIAGPKGSTFVVGSAAKGTFVAKYLGSGRPDKSFGDGGFALVRGLRSEPGSAVLDTRGRVVVLGTRLDVPDTTGYRARFVATVRLLPDGRFDQTYGGARPLLVVEDNGQKIGLDFSRSIGLSRRADGKLIMLGEAPSDHYAKTPTGPNFGLVRYLAGGPLKKK